MYLIVFYCIFHGAPVSRILGFYTKSSCSALQFDDVQKWCKDPSLELSFDKPAQVSHANLAAAGSSAAGTRGFLAVIFSYVQKLVLLTKLYCVLHIQKDDGQETK